MQDLKGKRIAILATDGFEQAELEVPRDRLRQAGATVEIISLKPGRIRGWDHTDWGHDVPVDKTIDAVSADDYDGVVLPGGQINPDLLRVEPQVLELIRSFWNKNKTVAAVCHAPWLLIETGLISGRHVTSYNSIKTDVINAGGLWEDSPVVVDRGLVTSRNPGDLEAFSEGIAGQLLTEHNRPLAA